jgi:outer membrane lipoprotein-sorting protein
MRLSILYFSFFIIAGLNAAAQVDQDPIKILDKFSANATGAPSVSMKFNLVTVDQSENTIDTLTGSVILFKDKYQLSLPDNIIWFDGTTSWSYLPAEKEVTINKADKNDNSFQNRPSAIFSMYKTGYKCRLIEERSDSYIIDLYPEDIKINLLRIRLSIGKQMMNLRSLEYKQRDGIIKTLHVLDYDLKQKPGPESFIYPQTKYKGVEVIDMR